MGRKGAKPHNWNGGLSTGRGDGYVDIFIPSHHRAHGHGYVFEHTLIAEQALGKPVPREAVIHHHTPEQIVICQDQGYHNTLHRRARAYKACGHASWRKCVHCKKYDPLEKLLRHSESSYIHADCRKERLENYRQGLRNGRKKRTRAPGLPATC